MKTIRYTLFALIAVAGIAGSALLADDGIEVLANDGIEVLGIEVLQNDGIEVLGIEVLRDGIEVLGTEVIQNDGIEVLGIEVLGIEVLGIEVLASGETQYTIRVPNAPAGSYVEADMTSNGADYVPVDAAPLTGDGEATIVFPANIPGNRIAVHTPAGEWGTSLELD